MMFLVNIWILFIFTWFYLFVLLTVFSELKEKIFYRAMVVISCYLFIKAKPELAEHGPAQQGFLIGAPRDMNRWSLGAKWFRDQLFWEIWSWKVNQIYFAGISEGGWDGGGRGHLQVLGLTRLLLACSRPNQDWRVES